MLDLKFNSFLFLSLIFLTCCSTQNQATTKDSQIEINHSSKVYKTPNYSDRDVVRTAMLDSKGNLWFGTTQEGVFRYDGQSFTNITKLDGLCDNYVNAIIEDKAGLIWFGTKDGICSYDGQSFEHFTIPEDGRAHLWGDRCNNTQVLSMLEDSAGNLWLGTCGGGAYRFDGESFTSFLANKGRLQSDSLHHNVIKSMVEDTDGNIWFTSLTHGGVSRYDGEQFTHFTEKHGLTNDMMFASHQDKSGNLWFGGIQSEEGLFQYNPGSNDFTLFDKEDGLYDSFITSFFEDEAGTLWLCSGNDICCYDGKTFTLFQTKDGQSPKEMSFIIADKAGNIWFGGKYGKLLRYDGETITDFTSKNI